jgi:hypothetical protein
MAGGGVARPPEGGPDWKVVIAAARDAMPPLFILCVFSKKKFTDFSSSIDRS